MKSGVGRLGPPGTERCRNFVSRNQQVSSSLSRPRSVPVGPIRRPSIRLRSRIDRMGKIRCKFTFHAFPLLYLAFFAPLREEIFLYPPSLALPQSGRPSPFRRTRTRTARRPFVSISVQVDGIINACDICMIRKAFQEKPGLSMVRHSDQGGNDEIDVLVRMCGSDCGNQL